MSDDLTSQVEAIVRQMLASPQGLLGRQFFPMLGAGRNQTGRVPCCVLSHNANQSIGNGGVWTTLAFNTERHDSDEMHDTATNTGRITFRTPGVYDFEGRVNWASAPTTPFLGVFKNGATFVSVSAHPSIYGQIQGREKFAAGDYIEFQVQHSSGGAINVLFNADYSPVFSAVLVGNL